MATCAVSGVAKSAAGALRPGVVISFYARVPIGVSGASLDDSLITVTTGDDGSFTQPLERDSLVRIVSTALGYDGLVIQVPDADTADFQTLVAEALAQPPTPANPYALEGDLLAEVARAEAAESALDAEIVAETGRAQGVEGELASAITDETTRAKAAEEALQTLLDWLHVSADKTINADVFSFLALLLRGYVRIDGVQDGILWLSNADQSAGILLDVATNGVLKVRAPEDGTPRGMAARRDIPMPSSVMVSVR